jgi:valyl-tRNA synthetase
MRIGRRLAIKLLNASKFVLLTGAGEALGRPQDVGSPLDRALLAELADLVEDATRAFDGYDYARALERTEAFFWGFCDHYVELAKGRAYGGQGEAGAASAKATLATALDVLLRLFAPFLPFASEEVWSWWRDGSVHGARWPDAAELRGLATGGDPGVYEVAVEVLGTVRKAKTEAKRSLRTPAERVTVRGTPGQLAALDQVRGDVCDAGVIGALTTEATTESGDGASDALSVEVALAAPEG